MAKLLSYFVLVGSGCNIQGIVMLRFCMCPEFWLCLESFLAMRTQESFRSKPLRIEELPSNELRLAVSHIVGCQQIAVFSESYDALVTFLLLWESTWAESAMIASEHTGEGGGRLFFFLCLLQYRDELPGIRRGGKTTFGSGVIGEAREILVSGIKCM